MKRLILTAFLALTFVPLGACTTLRQAVGDVAVSSSTTSNAQAKTLAEAIQLATLVEKSLDVAVVNGLLPVASLDELKVLVTSVHLSLKKAEAAQRDGNSPLVAAGIASFNEALTALNHYKAAKGIK